MKSILGFCFFLLSTLCFGQTLDGSWRVTAINDQPIENEETVMIYQEGYFVFASKEKETNHFLGTGGGTYSIVNGTYTETFDFHTYDPEKVSQTIPCELNFLDDNRLLFSYKTEHGTRKETWKRISDEENDLNGTWVITGRKREGELRNMTPGDRRTIKILGGGRFQWIAFNSITAELSGTGGGVYTAVDGKYVEKIEFFSRDDSRVGAELSFDYEVFNDEWHHSGLSSKGAPIYEIWSDYQQAYLNRQ
ncbi:hypothetical protein [Jiulongibacter sp. NS-SX5]|uniref:hypothetical protein n=1 Tax=Jiulongibacter sp. NS-SX5 TaxID=3463854 RepID=UPI00405A3BDC